MTSIDKSWYLTKVELDRANGYIRPLLAHESDVGGRGISLSVTDSGQPLDLTGYTITLDWMIGHEWGNHEFTVIDAANGKADLAYPKAMQQPGRVTARISILKGDAFTTGSKNFFIDVQAAPVSDELIESSEDYSVIGRLMTQTEQALRDAQAATEGIRQAEDAALKAAGAANSAAELAATNAEGAYNTGQAALEAAAKANSAASIAEAAAENASLSYGKMQELLPQAQSVVDDGLSVIEEAESATSDAQEAARSAASAASAADAAAKRAEAAASGKVVEFANKAIAVAAVSGLYT